MPELPSMCRRRPAATGLPGDRELVQGLPSHRLRHLRASVRPEPHYTLGIKLIFRHGRRLSSSSSSHPVAPAPPIHIYELHGDLHGRFHPFPPSICASLRCCMSCPELLCMCALTPASGCDRLPIVVLVRPGHSLRSHARPRALPALAYTAPRPCPAC